MPLPIYVIGHVNPDTDSIASAIGYAWLLRERDALAVLAARAGPVNIQTAWVLKNLELETPLLLTDASPRFETVMHRFDTSSPDKPLREAWAIANRTGGVAPIQSPDGKPYGMVTGKSLFEFLIHQVGPHPKQQEIKISEILELPCNQAADTHVPAFQASGRIRDSLTKILREERDEFWVVDEQGQYVGICRQRDLLNPPRLKVILVDHNEAQQSLASLEEAELLEILDHHRLGNPSTRVPIRFTVDTVGSTSTLVSERIEDAGLSAPPNIAGVMLAGLLSDTLILNSPTTTERDHFAAERLARWAFRGGSILNGETIQSYGEKVLAAGTGFGARTSQEILVNDLKVYQGGTFNFSISQVEVSDLHEITKHMDDLKIALSGLCTSKGLDFAVLMATDVVRKSSQLMLHNPPALLEDLPYLPRPDGTLYAEGVVSRKKQLLPQILGLLEV